MHLKRITQLATLISGAVILAACAGGTGSDSATQKQAVPSPAQPAVVTSDRPGERPSGAASPIASPAVERSPAASPAASPSPGAATIEIAGVTYNNRGIKDVSQQSPVEVRADNYYFEPTFLQGPRGDRVTLRIQNTSSTLHNFTHVTSASDQGQVRQDLPPNQTTEVEVTFPVDGAFHFFCVLHINEGMSGQLLAPGATPQVPESQGTAPVRSKQG